VDAAQGRPAATRDISVDAQRRIISKLRRVAKKMLFSPARRTLHATAP
jgi:hypothetical protein